VSSLTFIIGPCAIVDVETSVLEALAIKEVQKMVEEQSGEKIDIIFKSSFNKAQRTQGASYHGTGVHAGLAALQAVKDMTGFRVTSDVHSVQEIEEAANVLDLIQIPHQLCNYTEILEAAALTGLPISVKKGTFTSVKTMEATVAKIKNINPDAEIIIMERGNIFGYDKVVVDILNVARLKEIPGVFVGIDATHPAQDRSLAPILAMCGVSAGADVVFLESCLDPTQAPCDGHCMPYTQDLPTIVAKCMLIEITRQLGEDACEL
jgi:2-dehydro-3-deoxyphosphooctonate aldolase (KDO 8-P synthase)